MGYPSSAVEIPSGHRRSHRNYSPEPPLNRHNSRRSPDYSRRLKRQKYRKTLKRCIWNITPSPPRGEYDEVELDEEKEVEGDKEKSRRRKKGKGKSKSSRSKKRRSRRRRKRKKSSKRSSKRKSRSSSRRSSKRKRRSGSRKSKDSEDSEESSDSEELSKRKRSRSSSKKRSEKGSEDSASEKNSGSENDAKGKVNVDDGEKPVSESELLAIKEMIESRKKVAVSEDDELVGPKPLPRAEGHISYGGALRPGEGDAIAQYVQQGKRIPRRGEVGLSADEISRYENLGYVMSGSRHQRMNAIRIRKENQVYSAEDKRALAMFNYEEKAKREQKVMSDLQRLVQRHIGEETGPSHDPFGGSGKATEDPDA
ncbi:hypothetical protein CTI12_AA233600 [Artemisia annua]|uniref:NF-kappa-B-activating protein C-terminal domain-containing protein n=1 Tax=Artemisia annua TaxID=35608 RepID=A0A2U1NRV5_ARTAN|nr:hypothetical protein CTI12_AA233600 [Artemisia annua]